MTEEKIAKLRTMAERGTEFERANAKSILTKAGIPIEKPKTKANPFNNEFHFTGTPFSTGASIEQLFNKWKADKIKAQKEQAEMKKYVITIKYSSDLLLFAVLAQLRNKDIKVRVDRSDCYYIVGNAKDVDYIMEKFELLKSSFKSASAEWAKEYISIHILTGK